jgi:threonyl-tRNA synthetase
VDIRKAGDITFSDLKEHLTYPTVISPNMFNSKLWETSGHWQNYKDDMFTLDVEKEKWALKPMNCPGHCLIFDSRDRSYKELPIRMAEFGIIHRNEASGALTGLTRVRRFVQDDTHVFCMPQQVCTLALLTSPLRLVEQIGEEINSLVRLHATHLRPLWFRVFFGAFNSAREVPGLY